MAFHIPHTYLLATSILNFHLISFIGADISAMMSTNNGSRELQEEEEEEEEEVSHRDNYFIHRILKSHHHHKKLLPLDRSDKMGFFFATLGLMIAAGGGIGGGGVLVPIYILVMNFSAKHAIPLSNITVFGGAVANTLLNIRKRHPLADRPLVDWDLILVMEPLTIAGALIGAFLNKLLPEAVLVISLVALLSFTAYKTLKKAVRMYRAETKAMLAEKGVARIREDGTRESELTRMAREMEEEEEEDELEDVGRHEGDSPGDMELTINSIIQTNNQARFGGWLPTATAAD